MVTQLQHDMHAVPFDRDSIAKMLEIVDSILNGDKTPMDVVRRLRDMISNGAVDEQVILDRNVKPEELSAKMYHVENHAVNQRVVDICHERFSCMVLVP